MILDTSLLVDLLRDDGDARRSIERLEAEGSVLWIPTPALFELWEGVERADRPEEERRRIQEVLGRYTTIDFRNDHAMRAGRISGSLVRKGSMLDPVDVQIAGTALAERLPVLTRNAKHFGRVPDLDVVSY